MQLATKPRGKQSIYDFFLINIHFNVPNQFPPFPLPTSSPSLIPPLPQTDYLYSLNKISSFRPSLYSSHIVWPYFPLTLYLPYNMRSYLPPLYCITFSVLFHFFPMTPSLPSLISPLFQSHPFPSSHLSRSAHLYNRLYTHVLVQEIVLIIQVNITIML